MVNLGITYTQNCLGYSSITYFIPFKTVSIWMYYEERVDDFLYKCLQNQLEFFFLSGKYGCTMKLTNYSTWEFLNLNEFKVLCLMYISYSQPYVYLLNVTENHHRLLYFNKYLMRKEVNREQIGWNRNRYCCVLSLQGI